MSKRDSLIIAVVLAFASPLAAQDVEAPAPPGWGVEEIVVTAQKRAERLVDVGLSVTSLSGDDLRESRVEQVRDIAAYLPNVDIKEQVPGAIPVVTIRGVGLDDFSSTNSPAAGIYLDEVTLSSLALMSFDLYDLERIEVLKGPQGTLYGRNSTAGAINVLTAKPKQDWEAYVKGGYGSYATYDVEGMANAPVTDWLALRLSGKTIQQSEGFWTSRLDENGAANERDLGERDVFLGRAQAAVDVADWLTMNFKFEGLRQRSELGQPEFFGQLCPLGGAPIDPFRCTDIHGYSDTDGDPYEGDWKGEFPYDIDQHGLTANLSGELGDFATWTSVTGWIDFERFFHIDADATPFDQFDFFQKDEVQQVTQELRLAGTHELADWLVGGFYSSDEITVDTDGRHQDLIPLETSHIDADQTTRSAAGFVNGKWHLLENVDLVTGLRYTWESRDYVGGTDWAIEVPTVLEDTFIDREITDTNWSWKGGLEWRPIEDSLVYASVSKGVKSGGFFSGVTNLQFQLEPYSPESLTAYEIGAKTQGLLSVSGSLFYYDYSDVQTFMRSGGAAAQFIGNVGEARVWGGDVEATWLPLEGLTLQSGLGLLETELGAFVGPTGAAIPRGNELPNAPSTTFNVLGRYEFGVWQTIQSALQLDAHYSASTFKEATNDRLLASDSYWLLNARVALFGEDRVWEIAGWGRNLTDELYVVQGLNVGTFFIGNRNYNAPRTYGVAVSYYFG